ncbi:unnamed protein product, partial [Callosobruchus maculatus]
MHRSWSIFSSRSHETLARVRHIQEQRGWKTANVS